ncbi:hypothetical protein AUJ14_02495 [Candidatus Micrarchaeota archaeon CG1_02_55_22]|nr:MAG: hypothetical protein AUJ14_02495 [Candidatus Micrarchaeota archaeon CG1_02_55_22]
MGLFDDIILYGNLLWYAVLVYVAYWLYNWSKEKLGFSQVLVFVVAGLLIYFLVIEHPIIGAFGVITWIIISGGLLLVLGMFPSLYMLLKGHRQ